MTHYKYGKTTKYLRLHFVQKTPVAIIFIQRTLLGILKMGGSEQAVHWVSRPCFATKTPHYSYEWSENFINCHFREITGF